MDSISSSKTDVQLKLVNILERCLVDLEQGIAVDARPSWQRTRNWPTSCGPI